MLKSISAINLFHRQFFLARTVMLSMEKVTSLKRVAEDDEESVEAKKQKNIPRIKKKKCAMLISYSGQGYLGLQRNPGMKTIEEDILTALFKSDYISEEGFNQPQSFHFQRAARTDKGVSAVRQVLSMKLPEEIDVHKINSFLPDQIRVMGMKRTTKGFNCKGSCDARTYSYMMPSFALSPHSEESPPTQDYRVTPEVLQKTNDVLKNYLGTHNYYNFTSRRKPLDPSTQRFIMSFTCEDPVLCEGMEFVTLKVKGQSFMLHQIRKMVGLAIAIVRGLTGTETITKAWEKEKLDIPVAPGLGLVLEEVHYDRYNNRYGSDGIHERIDWSEFTSELEEFKKKYILSSIMKTEKEENSMLSWLESLPQHTYDVREEKAKESTNNDAENNDDD